MTIADAPDWYNAGGANPFSAQAVLLENANPSVGAPISVQIPTDSSPFHTLGIYAPYAGSAELPKLAVVGDQSGIIFYDNYLESDIQRFGGPVVVPITTLYDTSISFVPSVNNIVGVFAWLYLDSVPPVSRPYAAQLLSIGDIIVGGSTRNLLTQDLTCTTFVLDSITYSIGVAVPQACLLKSAAGQFFDAFASPGFTSDTHDLGGLVVLSNTTYELQAIGGGVANSFVLLRYWRSFATDGLDIL